LRSQTDEISDRLYQHDADFDVADVVARLAKERGISRAQIALAWILSKPGISAPIVGTSKVAHLDDAVAAVHLALRAEEIAALEAPYVPHPVRGHQ
jgi:aryl-alcohol dehydrogenase (NADP+)